MNGRTPPNPPPPGRGVLIVVFTLAGAVGLVYGWLELSTWMATGNWIPGNPVTLVVEWMQSVSSNRFRLLPQHMVVGSLLGLLAFATAVFVFTKFLLRPNESDLSSKAKHMGKGSELSYKTLQTKTAAGRLTTGETIGLMFARTLQGGAELWAGFRDGMLVLMGPGGGKTTGISVPLSLAAPGVLFCTSNKRDIADAIRGPRQKVGKVWVFDPQNIANYHGGGVPSWWVNPLRYVTDEVRAHKLAKVWMDAVTPVGATKNSYFDTAGPNLMANLLLAAAVAEKPITQVFLWLTNYRNRMPITILREAGYILPAAALEGIYDDPEEQRAGVFGTAAEMLSFLNNKRVISWVTNDDPARREFIPEQFVRSGADTLVSLSKEGIATTGPLTAFLTIAVLDAAEAFGDEHAHGRLPIPLVVILDEAANICRIRDLPGLYSHYGSRSIFLVTILQNWAQGKTAWGEDGLLQLWSASTIRIIGSGLAEANFLRDVSSLVGDQYKVKHTTGLSGGKGGYSRNTTHDEKPVLKIDDLNAIKPGQVVVFPSGGRPVAAKVIPWFDRKDIKAEVENSIATYEPRGGKNLVAVK